MSTRPQSRTLAPREETTARRSVKSNANPEYTCYSSRAPRIRSLSSSTMASCPWRSISRSLLSHFARIDRIFASVGGRGRSQMTPGVSNGENRIKLPKSASSVTRIRSVSMANRRTSRSVFPAKPAARTSRTSTASVAAAHCADRMLKFSSNNRRT